MAKIEVQIRIKAELGDRRPGVPFKDDLGRVSDEASRFLIQLAADLGLDASDDAKWRALPLRKGSLVIPVVYDDEVPARIARSYVSSMERIARYPSRRGKLPRGVRNETISEFARIGEKLEPGTVAQIGVVRVGEKQPRSWGEISRDRSAAILESIRSVVTFFTSIQGTIYSLTKGADRPFVHVRDFASGTLVRCFYKPEHYASIVSLLKRSDAVVIVSGFASSRQGEQRVVDLEIDRIDGPEPLTEDEFEGIFGSAPEITGNVATEDFVDRIRRGDD